jgi:RNA polymerase sigma-70 factor (sigma-E family)
MAGVGAEASFLEHFPRLYRRAYQAAFRLSGDREGSQEVAQEALIRAYQRWDRLDGRREGWVVVVATNLAISRFRRDRLRRQREGHATPSAESDPELDAARVDLLRALQQLPRRQRQVAILRYLEDWSEADVAALLGCSIGTVKRHASRATAGLRRLLDTPSPTLTG